MGNLFMIGNYKNKRNELTNNYNRNDKKQLFTGITKESPTKITFQSCHATSIDTAIEQTDNNTITKKPKINNIHFGDDIFQDPQAQSTRIFFQHFNGLECSTTSYTLLSTYRGIQDKQIDIYVPRKQIQTRITAKANDT